MIPPIPQTVLGPNQPLGVPINTTLTNSPINMTAVTSPTLVIERPDGSTVTWAASLVPYNDGKTVNSVVTPTMANFQYVWLPGDLSTGGLAWHGIWSISPNATFNGNPVVFDPTFFRVINPWGGR